MNLHFRDAHDAHGVDEVRGADDVNEVRGAHDAHDFDKIYVVLFKY
jgi:hypothetical protein